ncbi:MAG: multidrug effflux MFS transporter [Chlamydiia bacterium]|nr:multidrug effflux MFS transporter [Chlamydiia bacterium]
MKNKLPFSLILCLVGYPQISETIYTPALVSLARGLGVTPHAAELTLSFYFLGFAAGVFCWGMAADRLGRRPSMLLGIFVYILGCIACASAPNIWILLAARFMQAFGASTGSVITQTMLRDSLEGTERQKFFALIGAALSLSPAIGPLAGGVIADLFDWRACLWVLSLFGTLLFFWSVFKLPETQKTGAAYTPLVKVAKRMGGDKELWQSVLYVGILNGIAFSFYSEAPFVFIETFGFSAAAYGLIGLVIAAAGLTANLFNRWSAGRWSQEKLLKRSAALLIISSSALFLLGGSALGYALLSGALFFSIGLMIPTLLSGALKNYPECLGTAGALFGMAYYLLISLSTAGMSFLHNGSIGMFPLYVLMLTLLSISSRFFSTLRRMKRPFSKAAAVKAER